MSNEIMPTNATEEIITTPEDLLFGAQAQRVSTLPISNDPVELAKQVNYINNIDHALNDVVNTTVNLVDIICQNVQVHDMNSDDDTLVTRPRTIVIDDKGVTYATTSPSFAQGLATIFQTMGQPHYDTPLPIKILKQKSNSNFEFLTANIDLASPVLKNFKRPSSK